MEEIRFLFGRYAKLRSQCGRMDGNVGSKADIEALPLCANSRHCDQLHSIMNKFNLSACRSAFLNALILKCSRGAVISRSGFGPRSFPKPVSFITSGVGIFCGRQRRTE